MQWKDGLIRRVAFLEGDNLVVFYFLSALAICLEKQGALSWGENLAVLRGGLPWRGQNLLSLYITTLLHLTSGLIWGVAYLEVGEFIVIVFYYFIAVEIWPDNKDGVVFVGDDRTREGVLYNPRNQNSNLMARTKFLN